MKNRLSFLLLSFVILFLFSCNMYVPFDMTENTYVRGNRIYFMCSRRINDITYTYYDTETKSQGDVVRVTFDDVINTVRE